LQSPVRVESPGPAHAFVVVLPPTPSLSASTNSERVTHVIVVDFDAVDVNVPSVAVTEHVHVSPLFVWAAGTEAEPFNAGTATPFFNHEKDSCTGSTSGSVDVAEQVMSTSVSVLAARVIDGVVGGELPVVAWVDWDCPFSTPSNAVPVQVSTSPRRTLPGNVVPVPAGAPFFCHATTREVASLSASRSVTGAQVIGDVASGVAGAIVTPANVGGVFATVMLAVAGVLVAKPSLGVAAQRTTSARLKPDEIVAPVPAATPLTVHANETLTMSPSASLVGPAWQVSVCPARIVDGASVADAIVGGVFTMVTVFERTSAPVEPASLGVAAHCTVRPRVSAGLVKVFVVAAFRLPSTNHAYAIDTGCPSPSSTADSLQVNVAPAVATPGESATAPTVGIEFCTVTDALWLLPASKLSRAVAVH
jgi:hypothetical protein